MKEHNIVVFLEDVQAINEKIDTIPQGTKGTIVHVYSDEHVLVEYDLNGETEVSPIATEHLIELLPTGGYVEAFDRIIEEVRTGKITCVEIMEAANIVKRTILKGD